MSTQTQQELTQEQAINSAVRDSIEEAISLLEGVGPLCKDIDELVKMLELAVRNDSQLALIRAHMAPKRLRR